MEFTVSFDHYGRTFSDIDVLSLSAGGLYVALPMALRGKINIGDDISGFNFELPELHSCHPGGRIVHQIPMGDFAGCGVEFTTLAPEEERFISAYVDAKLKEFGLYSDS